MDQFLKASTNSNAPVVVACEKWKAVVADIHMNDNTCSMRGGGGETVGCSKYLCSISKLSIVLEDLSSKPEQIQKALFKYVFDTNTRQYLQQIWALNYDDRFKCLQPISTAGDGNCLSHSVSIFMWGMHDYDCILRNLIHGVLLDDATIGKHAIKKRWQNERFVQNSAIPGGGLVYDSLEWQNEWENQVDMSKVVEPGNRQPNVLQYDSLDHLHIFVVCNIIRRPIIVIADKMYRSASDDSSFAPNLLSGIYLPILWPSEEIYRKPVIIGYHQNHFVPLIPYASDNFRGKERINAVPLCEKNGELLKVHFLMPDEQSRMEEILYNYVDLIEVPNLAGMHTQGSVEINEGSKSRQLSGGASSLLSWITSGFTSIAGAVDHGSSQRVVYHGHSNTMLAARLHDPEHVNTSGLIRSYIQTVESRYRAAAVNNVTCTPGSNPGRGECGSGSSSSNNEGAAADLIQFDDMVLSLLPGCECSTSGCANNTSLHTHPYCHECCPHNAATTRGPSQGYKRPGCENMCSDTSTSGYCTSCTSRYFVPSPSLERNNVGNICSTLGCADTIKYDSQSLCYACYQTLRHSQASENGEMLRVEPDASIPTDMVSVPIPSVQGPDTVTSIVSATTTACPVVNVSESVSGITSVSSSAVSDPMSVSRPNSECEESISRVESLIPGAPMCSVSNVGRVAVAASQTPEGDNCQNISKEKMEQPESSSSSIQQSCVGPQCYNIGVRELNGLCKACYDWLQVKQVQQGLRDMGTVPTLTLSRSSVSKCFNPSCPREADIEYGRYCQECFIDSTKTSEGEGGSKVWPRFRPLDIPGRYVPCASGDCLSWGLPENNGLCQNCFSNYLKLITATD